MPSKPKLIAKSKFLQFVDRGGWSYVTRPNLTGVIGIVAVTDAGELVLIEQRRPPLDAVVIEIPAGLAGDLEAGESLAVAAKRELLEETGFKASRVKKLVTGASSAGLTDERITMFLATGLRAVSGGPKDESENITLRLVPLDDVEAYVAREQKRGKEVDLKVFAALHFARAAR